MAAPIVNGVVLSKENIAFLKQVRDNDRKAEIAKVKNFKPVTTSETPVQQAEVVTPKPQKTKISHAARKARVVARSIAADPKNRKVK